jgi:CheY-like chemotaxis protein
MGSAGSNNENHADASTVLVVEDEVLIRMATADYLRVCGYRVVEAGSGDEAVAVLKTDIRVDVVFTDVSMPGTLNGLT